MASDVFGILGTVVAGAYQVDEVVAEGGFGVVYRAYHSGFRAPVALKCLKIPQAVSGDHADEFLEQFRAEAELLFRLSASLPTVVRPLHVDAMTAPDGSFVPFMALEWLEGDTLEQIMLRRRAEGRPPVSVKKLTRMLTPVARALERAHNFVGPDGPISIVHRDLKPENIFLANVAGEEIVKILDFGIGKAKSVASQVAGRASQSDGALASFTPAYGAPEQWVPKRYGQTGPWTDVWGLALTMVEVMAARPIIDGDQAAMMGTALDASHRPTPRNEGVDVSDEVEAVFDRALALDPRDRYDDAGLFWNDLMAALGMKVGAVTSFRRRDLRAEADASVPRVEAIEAAMPVRSSAAPQSVERMAPTLAAESAPPESVERSPFAKPAPVSRSGEYRAMVPETPSRQAAQPSADGSTPPLEIPDLVPSGSSGGAAESASARAAPAASQRASAAPSEESVLDPGPRGGSAMSLDLDLAPGERPVARASSSGQYSAVSLAAAPSAAGAPPSAASVPTSGGSPAIRTPARPPSSRLPPVRPLGSSTAAESPLKQYGLPGGLILSGIVVTVADQLYAGSAGEVMMVGPLRASFIATPLVLAGIGLLVWRLVQKRR